jgi:cell division protein FtsB
LRWLLALLLLVLVGLQYRLWFADGSLAERARLEQQLEAQSAVNADLGARNAVLEREVIELQTGKRTIEQRAREQLGLVGEGETFYQIVPAGSGAGRGEAEAAAPDPAVTNPEETE